MGLDHPVGYSCWPALGPPAGPRLMPLGSTEKHQLQLLLSRGRGGREGRGASPLGSRGLWPRAETFIKGNPVFLLPTHHSPPASLPQPFSSKSWALPTPILMLSGSPCPHPPFSATQGLRFVCPSPTPFPASHLERPDLPRLSSAQVS